MNIVQLQEQLKNFSQDQLVREMQMPSGSAPQFLVLGEIMRRQKMQQDFAAQQAKGAPQSTVAEDAIAAAGVPQGGIASMAQALAPQTNMAESTGVQAMAYGGPVKKMAEGDKIVRGGMVLTEQEDGTYRDEQGRVVRSVGEDILSGLATLRDIPSRLGTAARGVSAGFADEMNASLTSMGDTAMRAQAGENALSMRAGPDTSYRYPEVPAVDVSAMDRAGMALEGRTGFPTGMPTREEEAIAARNELLGGLVEEFDLRQPVGFETAGRGAPSPAPAPAAITAGPSFENVGREVGAASIMDMANTAAAVGADDADYRARLAQTADTMAALRRERSAEPVPMSNRRAAYEEGRASGNPLDGTAVGGFLDMLGGQTVEEKAAADAARAAADTTPRADRDQQGIAAIPTPEEIAAERAATTPPAPPGGGGGGAGGIAGGAGGMSSFEQELMDMLGRREKAAEQDKWLALAQVGLNMMSSTQPTLAGAIGEAGVKGVEAARSARDQYDKDRLDLLGALEQSRQARAAAAARAARGASSGGIRPLNASGIMTQQKYMLDLAESRLNNLTGGQDPTTFAAMLKEAVQGGDTMAASQLLALDTAQQQYDSAYRNYMDAATALGALTMSAPEEDDLTINAMDE